MSRSFAFDPPADCTICPRLAAFRAENQRMHPAWFNGAVPSFGDPEAWLLIVGLAPGLRGANRTARPFTGDFAGDLLYSTLIKFNLAEGRYGARPDDGLRLTGAVITNAVRCVPPQNKPVGAEINNCRPFLAAAIDGLPRLTTILTLGKIAHDSTVRALGGRLKDHPFGHGNRSAANGLTLVASYHCSRYNTNTGKLTAEMFEAVFADISRPSSSAATRR